MTTIPISQIDEGERGRSVYEGVESLADSIEHNGLIQPIVLSPKPDGRFKLCAGGTRLQALKLLGVTELHHGVTSCPGKYGYLLKESEANELGDLLTEIAENLDRHDLDWRDEMKLILKAWKMCESEANIRGQHILLRDFGASIGVAYHDVRCAIAIHEDVVLHPDRYLNVTSMRAAYSVLLKANAAQLAILHQQKTVSKHTKGKQVQVIVPNEIQEKITKTEVNLSNVFHNADSLQFMSKMDRNSVDHIITDPPYALDPDLIGAAPGRNQGNINEIRSEHQVEENLDLLQRFLSLAGRVVKEGGFVVLFYDTVHERKLVEWANAANLVEQRWPLVWHKLDYRSNAAPQKNFTKNYETALVLRKGNAVLAHPQSSSIFSCASGTTVRDFAHPFAKPIALWKWIYTAVTIRGQTVFDPFVGAGSSAVAAMQHGLLPTGCEVVPAHYGNLLVNLQTAYRKELGQNILFT